MILIKELWVLPCRKMLDKIASEHTTEFRSNVVQELYRPLRRQFQLQIIGQVWGRIYEQRWRGKG